MNFIFSCMVKTIFFYSLAALFLLIFFSSLKGKIYIFAPLLVCDSRLISAVPPPPPPPGAAEKHSRLISAAVGPGGRTTPPCNILYIILSLTFQD